MTVLDHWWEEASPNRRIDLNFGNMGLLLSLILPSLAIAIRGPSASSPLVHMSIDLQKYMCGCIFIGCGMKLHGAMAGRRFWFPATTIKRCYAYGFSGAPIATAGLITYGYFILSYVPSPWALMTGLSTPLFGVGIAAQALLYYLEYRRIDRNEKRLREVERKLG